MTNENLTDNDDIYYKHMVLQNEYTLLQHNYTKLQNEYTTLQNDFNKLQKDFSENTIIQSMNDMKDQYNQLLAETVPLYRFNLLSNKHKLSEKKINVSSYLIDRILNRLKRIDDDINQELQGDLYKAEFELSTVKEILEEPNNTF